LVAQESAVDSFTDVINSLIQLLIKIGNLAVNGLVAIELWTREQLALLGLSPQLQTVVMLVLAVVLILGAFRLFGGLVRVAFVVVLILVAIHIMLPILPH
jgi:hypothetical protein